MKFFYDSKSLNISIFISLFLHLCLLLFLYYSGKPLQKIDNSPMSVDFLAAPPVKSQTENPSPIMERGKTRAPAAKPETPALREVPVPAKSTAVPEATERPAPEGAKVPPAPIPHPVEIPQSAPSPGIKELTPSLDRLAKMAEENGKTAEEGKEEETVSIDSGDEKYTSYLHGVKFKIEGVWRYPEAAKKSELQGRGLISFTVERDGAVSELKLLNSSGYPILDEAIMQAIRTASPFNPMTENMKAKRLNIVASFEYALVVQRMWGQ
jgi:periplasmic protein TonB